MDERALLERLRGGEKDAFDSIFREYYPHLVGVAESMLREREAAEADRVPVAADSLRQLIELMLAQGSGRFHADGA